VVSGSRPASCGFEGVWPVASTWVDEGLAEDFSCGEFGDGDGGVADGSGCGFEGRVLGVSGCLTFKGSAGSFGVVGVLESGELGLKLGDGCSGWSGVEPALLGLVEPLDFPLGLRVAGGTSFCLMPSAARSYSKPFRPPVNPAV